MMRPFGFSINVPFEEDCNHRVVPVKILDVKPPAKPLKAIILVAGKGTRLRPLTNQVPKPLLPLHGHPILEYILDGLLRTGIREFCLVVGYKADRFRSWIDQTYLSDPIHKKMREVAVFSFINQTNINGTGGAVLLTKSWAGDSCILVTYGDILMSWTVYDRLVDIFRKNIVSWLLVGNPTEDPSLGAAIYYDDSQILDMIEKPPKIAPHTDLNNAGCYIFPPEIYELLAKTSISPRGEIELTAPLIEKIRSGQSPLLIKMTSGEFWCDIGTILVYNALEQSSDWEEKVKNLPEVV